MNATGLAPHGDPDAVRWIAVRHGADHIHLVATLVRQDGTTAWAWNERYKAQTAARDLEHRYRLHRLGPADHTSHHRPSPAEQNKTQRQGLRQIPRDQLRHQVRAAAAATNNEEDFFTHLHDNGVLVRLRHSTTNPDTTTGYAVGLPHHTTPSGDTIWYSGGRLAPDLTLPQLRKRWKPTAEPTHGPRTPSRQRHDLFDRAATIAQLAADEITHGPAGPEAAFATAYGAADLLTALAAAVEGPDGGPLTHAAELLDRATRPPHGRPHPPTNRANDLRALGRLIAATGRLTNDKETTSAIRLILTIALLADNLANLTQAHHRLHQANAAKAAATELRQIARATRESLELRPARPTATTRSDIAPTPSGRERRVSTARADRR